MLQRRILDAIQRAEPGIGGGGKTGPGAPPSHAIPWAGQGPAAFKDRPDYSAGPNPNTSPVPWVKAFIPPLALFNDASQWVNRLQFLRPMTIQQTPDSNPPLRAQYFTPPPIAVQGGAAGALNQQQQLGMLVIQATRLTGQASLYYGS